MHYRGMTMSKVELIKSYAYLRGGFFHPSVSSALGISSSHLSTYVKQGSFRKIEDSEWPCYGSSLDASIDSPLDRLMTYVDSKSYRANRVLDISITGTNALYLLGIWPFKPKGIWFTKNLKHNRQKVLLNLSPVLFEKTPKRILNGLVIESPIYALYRAFLTANLPRYAYSFGFKDRASLRSAFEEMTSASKERLQVTLSEKVVHDVKNLSTGYEILRFYEDVARLKKTDSNYKSAKDFLVHLSPYHLTTEFSAMGIRYPSRAGGINSSFGNRFYDFCDLASKKGIPERTIFSFLSPILFFDAAPAISKSTARGLLKIKSVIDKIDSSQLIAAVLFGSRARGTEKESSDYDILLISNDLNLVEPHRNYFEPPAFNELRKGLEEIDGLRTDIVVTTEADFLKEPLFYSFVNEGYLL
ncbi:MAG: nucleotidyltransferase domain-containing protein [Proteobacteria bacterium]|nr:MAG: nucleotidyltransferase domain-containing protein [Pseudomonadota bacterium]